MKDSYKELPKFASWLLAHADEYLDVSFKMLRELDIPMMRALSHLSDEELKALSSQSNIVLFESMIDGTALEKSLNDLDKFYKDQNPLLRSDQVVAEDLIRAYLLRERAFRKFIPRYTDDLETGLQIIIELRSFHATLEETAVTNLISLKNKELRVKNEILEAAQQQAQIGNWHLEMSTGEVFWSQQMFEIFEIKDGIPLKADGLYEFIPEDIRPVVIDNHNMALSEKHEYFTTEFPIITKAGNWKYLSGRGRIDYDEKGNPTEVTGIYQDITEIQQTFKALESSQFVLSEAQTIAKIGSWVYIVPDQSLKWTLEHYRLFEVQQDEPVKWESFYEHVDPDYVGKLRESITAAIDKGIGFDLEYRMVLPDGTVRWIRSQAKVILNLNSGKAERIYGTSQDITDRIQAFRRLKKNQEKLAEAQQIAMIGSWDLDLRNNEMDWTEEHYKIYGLENGLDPLTASSESIHSDDREELLRLFENAKESGQGYNIRYRIILPDGSIKWVRSTCRTEADRITGEICRIYGTTQDITDVVEKEFQLRELNEDLEKIVDSRTKELMQTNENLQHFAYIVSHDLKAPLRAIANIVNFITSDYATVLDDSGREYLRLLDERTRFMETLIQNILEYSRAGGKSEEAQEIDLGEVIENISSDLNEWGTVNIQSQELPVIEGRYTPIYQVFQNLISNAVKHVDRENGKVEVGYKTEDDSLLFWVKDNGPGIDPKHFGKIFKIFQTLGDEKSGSGIGLAIVRKLLGVLGGKVWVESELGKGATFYFTLPGEMLKEERVHSKK